MPSRLNIGPRHIPQRATAEGEGVFSSDFALADLA
jgi:hypothetical protein